MGQQIKPMGSSDVTDEKPLSTMESKQATVALFYDIPESIKAFGNLVNRGFQENQLGIALRDRTHQGVLLSDKGTGQQFEAIRSHISEIPRAIHNLSEIYIPSIGPIIAGGLFVFELSRLHQGFSPRNVMVQTLFNLGVQEEEACNFDLAFQTGGVLICVLAENRTHDAITALEMHGADFGRGSTRALSRFD